MAPVSDPSGTQKPSHGPPLDEAEFYLEIAIEAAHKEPVVSGAHVVQLAIASALVSLAKTMDDLSGKMSLCGHGYLGAICHLCMSPR